VVLKPVIIIFCDPVALLGSNGHFSLGLSLLVVAVRVLIEFWQFLNLVGIGVVGLEVCMS
jgi:hypothetical protein